jgi:DNA polymerase-3 subunit alpha
LSKVEELVWKAAEMGQPAIGLQEHGNMAGSVQLYQACKKAGILAFPGTEFYTVPSIAQHKRDYASKDVKATRFHLGVVAHSRTGYQNLVALNTLAHRNHFHKPLLDFEMLAGLSEDHLLDGVGAMTGCFFGYAIQQLTHVGYQAARQWVQTLCKWFPNVYVEMQNHHIHHHDGWTDDEIADVLMELADDLGLPAIVSQDTHYLVPADRTAHDELKRLVAFGPDPDDAIFPGDGFHLADRTWMYEHHHTKRWARGCEGLSELLKSHCLDIPVLDHYSYSVPHLTPRSHAVLAARCTTALQHRLRTLPARYTDRLISELDVIKTAGMADYLLLTAQVCDYMRQHTILFQTRGSAAGSLACWLLGITNVDPIKHDLRFERFLSTDRTKPPDIDLDIEHGSRQRVLNWLESKYAVHQISTWMQYSLAGEDDGKVANKGSLRIKYFAKVSKIGGVKTWMEVPAADKHALYDLGQRGLYSGLGTNAAGVVVTERAADFHRLVPLHHMTRGGLVSQYNKNDVESLGLVKLDILGSKTLTVIRETLNAIGKTDTSFIPMSDGATFSLIRSGQTAGIFQLEGGATRRGLKDLKPATLKHVIAAMALFRPAIMSTGATEAYCARKNNEEAIPQRHPVIDEITKDTYGILLYQEQTMDVVRRLGLGTDDLNIFLKAVKASNKDIDAAGVTMTKYMSWLETACREAEMDEDTHKWIKDAILGFSEYSFNKAHATVYGVTAYQCAYLAVHHRLAYHAALLAIAATDPDKERLYLQAAKSRGVVVRRPDINTSKATYSIDERRGCLRRGLNSVKGVGAVAAKELQSKQPFTSFEDLVERIDVSKCKGVKTYRETRDMEDINGTVRKLLDAGVLDTIVRE